MQLLVLRLGATEDDLHRNEILVVTKGHYSESGRTSNREWKNEQQRVEGAIEILEATVKRQNLLSSFWGSLGLRMLARRMQYTFQDLPSFLLPYILRYHDERYPNTWTDINS